MKNWSFAVIAIAIAVCACAGVSCSKSGAGKKDGKAASHAGGVFVMMEKTLSDQPGRPRTTMKVLLPDAKDAATAEAGLKAALDKIRADDPELKAAIIWAYHTRAELNGSNYTAGKLEWSADGKDFNGAAPLTPNPKLDVAAK